MDYRAIFLLFKLKIQKNAHFFLNNAEMQGSHCGKVLKVKSA